MKDQWYSVDAQKIRLRVIDEDIHDRSEILEQIKAIREGLTDR